MPGGHYRSLEAIIGAWRPLMRPGSHRLGPGNTMKPGWVVPLPGTHLATPPRVHLLPPTCTARPRSGDHWDMHI